MRTLRRTSQVFFLLLFLWLVWMTRYERIDILALPVSWFFQLDPLVALTTALSAHALPPGFGWAILLVLLTLLFGRFFCGWVCPLGTMCQAAGSLRPRSSGKPEAQVSVPARRIKYLMLTAFLFASVYAVQLTGWMDPISLTVRSLTLAVFPAVDAAVRSSLEFLCTLGIFGAPEATSLSRDHLLLRPEPAFGQGVLIGLLFLLVVGSSLIVQRFWCRTLCPLGALLGLVGRLSPLRLKQDEGCTQCGLCASSCPGAADPQKEDTWKKEECYLCWNCIDDCPTRKTSFTFSRRSGKPSAPGPLDRRGFLAATATGAVSAALLTSMRSPIYGHHPEAATPGVIRPPGSEEEEEFLARCLRCGACMKVCPTNVIQPAAFEAGFEGLWTPVLDMHRGYCSYSCTLCGQSCPTEAIHPLPLKVKQARPIGMAHFDRGRCLPWAFDKDCICCEEHCPIPDKAIFARETEVTRRDGRKATLLRPYVDLDKCIGCGVCEHVCPIEGDPAIRVVPVKRPTDPVADAPR